jgi:hypothetical protein
MNNPVKVLVGSVVGAGIGLGISKVLEMRAAGETAPTSDPLTVTYEPKTSIIDSLKERWERAKLNGDLAKESKEAELRAYFRTKVNDPQAMRIDPLASPAAPNDVVAPLRTRPDTA